MSEARFKQFYDVKVGDTIYAVTLTPFFAFLKYEVVNVCSVPFSLHKHIVFFLKRETDIVEEAVVLDLNDVDNWNWREDKWWYFTCKEDMLRELSNTKDRIENFLNNEDKS